MERFDRNKIFEVGPSNSKDFLYNETSYHEHDASFDCEHSVKVKLFFKGIIAMLSQMAIDWA